MNIEALILRRCYPVPVTFADLRAAYVGPFLPWRVLYSRENWTAALKEVTSALDEVYAVVDGREVRVALAAHAGRWAYCGTWSDITKVKDRIACLLDKADRAGYWERPHEVRLDLIERPVSHDEVARAVVVGQQHVERKVVRS